MYQCKDCYHIFQEPDKELHEELCPRCGSERFSSLREEEP